MNAGDFELSDCWSSEKQPATYYRTAAARARRLHADATTPRVKQHLDNMITHCERLAGKGRTRPVARSIDDDPEIKSLYHWNEIVQLDEPESLISELECLPR